MIMFFYQLNNLDTPPPKFNIAPKKCWLEDYIPVGKVTFQGRAVKLREGNCSFLVGNPIGRKLNDEASEENMYVMYASWEEVMAWQSFINQAGFWFLFDDYDGYDPFITLQKCRALQWWNWKIANGFLFTCYNDTTTSFWLKASNLGSSHLEREETRMWRMLFDVATKNQKKKRETPVQYVKK